MYYHSHDENCKSPFGAVSCGSEVFFALYPQENEAVTACTLLTYWEFADEWHETPLQEEYSDEKRRFCGKFTAPHDAELVWYHFRLHWADGGECCLDKNGFSPWNTVTPWQLTVYRKNHTPSWFGEGITYQIFPDRFFRAEKRSVETMVGHRKLHEAWDETPDYLPNENGKITNSDFFGGDLAGITQKLDYLASLGVRTVYCNPIFESASNHRYDTADYRSIDPLLGTQEDYCTLCAEAKTRGIRVLLDGVFNHTGSDSIYFNKYGSYPNIGAYQSCDSPYAPWYHFSAFPDRYDSWWGIDTLPAVNEENSCYVNYIIEDEDSVIKHWLRCGASGWRLDVADELPDGFIEKIRAAMEEISPDHFLLGEVWEDGSQKIAYGKRRRYLLGSGLHGLMNYPFRTAVIAYLRGGKAQDFQNEMESLRENYPRDVFYSCLNFLGTHDTPRILTVLGLQGNLPPTKGERASFRLSESEREQGLLLERLAALIQFTFPGSPCIYYGDEVGMEGFEDPFNRCPYPWGQENLSLRNYYALLGTLRNQNRILQSGQFRFLAAKDSLLAFLRFDDEHSAVTVINAGAAPQIFSIPWSGKASDALTDRIWESKNGNLSLEIPPYNGVLLFPTN